MNISIPKSILKYATLSLFLCASVSAWAVTDTQVVVNNITQNEIVWYGQNKNEVPHPTFEVYLPNGAPLLTDSIRFAWTFQGGLKEKGYYTFELTSPEYPHIDTFRGRAYLEPKCMSVPKIISHNITAGKLNIKIKAGKKVEKTAPSYYYISLYPTQRLKDTDMPLCSGIFKAEDASNISLIVPPALTGGYVYAYAATDSTVRIAQSPWTDPLFTGTTCPMNFQISASQGTENTIKLTWVQLDGFSKYTLNASCRTGVITKEKALPTDTNTLTLDPASSEYNFQYGVPCQFSITTTNDKDTYTANAVGWTNYNTTKKLSISATQNQSQNVTITLKSNPFSGDDVLYWGLARSEKSKATNLKRIAVTPITQTTCIDPEDPIPGKTYYYFATPLDSQYDIVEQNGWSKSAKGYRGLVPPEHVVADSNLSYEHINVNWSATEGATHYKVYRDSESISKWIKGNSFCDESIDLSNYENYTYSVRSAVSSGGKYASPDYSKEHDGALSNKPYTIVASSAGVNHTLWADSVAIDPERAFTAFTQKPSFTATYIDTFSKKPKSKKTTLSANFVKGSSDTQLSFTAKNLIPLFNTSSYNSAIKSGLFTYQFIDSETNQHPVEVSFWMKGVSKEKSIKPLKLRTFLGLRSQIPQLEVSDTIYLSTLTNKDSSLYASGMYWGTSKPKAWLEYKENQKIKKLNLTVSATGKFGKYYTDSTGKSEAFFYVKQPKWDVVPEELYFVISTKKGMASHKITLLP